MRDRRRRDALVRLLFLSSCQWLPLVRIVYTRIKVMMTARHVFAFYDSVK